MKLFILVNILLLISTQSMAAKLNQEECESLGLASASIMSNRNKGVSRERLSSALPSLEQPEEKRQSSKYLLLMELHKAVDEVFLYDGLATTVYMVFKSESCLQKVKGNKSTLYEDAYPHLLKCSDPTLGNDIVECSMKAAGVDNT
jgi:hypothetical protein